MLLKKTNPLFITLYKVEMAIPLLYDSTLKVILFSKETINCLVKDIIAAKIMDKRPFSHIILFY